CPLPPDRAHERLPAARGHPDERPTRHAPLPAMRSGAAAALRSGELRLQPMIGAGTVRRSPLPWKLLTVAFIFLGITAISVAMTFAAIAVQSAVRSYVAGEGYWSKAQRDAAFSLYRYGQTGDPEHLRRFHESVAVPLGDRAAREALEAGADRKVAV